MLMSPLFVLASNWKQPSGCQYTIDFSYVHNRIPYCKVEKNNNKTTHHETLSATAGTQWNVGQNSSDIKEQMSCFPLYKVQKQTLYVSMV